MKKQEDKQGIKQDTRNYRIHGEENKRIIKKSLKELGAGRSILLDNENGIIAGNGVFEQAESLGIPIRIIETDGTELIAVKRSDLKPGEKKRQKLALIDNHASDTSTFDNEVIVADFDKTELLEFNIYLNYEYSAENMLSESDINTSQEFDPLGVAKDVQRVVFIFDNKDEAEKYLKKLKVEYKKMNMAWQVNLSSLSI